MSFKLSNEAKAEKFIDVRENDRMYEKSTFIWQRFCAWSIHSTLRLHSLRTTDLYNERSKLRREVPVDISSLWGSLVGESLLFAGPRRFGNYGMTSIENRHKFLRRP